MDVMNHHSACTLTQMKMKARSGGSLMAVAKPSVGAFIVNVRTISSQLISMVFNLNKNSHCIFVVTCEFCTFEFADADVIFPSCSFSPNKRHQTHTTTPTLSIFFFQQQNRHNNS